MTELEALASALAIENQVVYGYGVVGARLDKAPRHYALATLEVHLARRDQLELLIRARGGTPQPAAPAYTTPHITGERDAALLAAKLEDACAGAAWDLVAGSVGRSQVRTLAVGWISDAAIRAAHWRGNTLPDPALPGMPS